MYKIALHIGLPKTATTSLQSNLLYRAHLEGKLNFLGRHGEPFSDDYFNPFEDVYSKLNKKDMSHNEIHELREELSKHLKHNMLNVISEEALSLVHGVHYVRLENLKRILSFCDVSALVSLRNPLDFFFSYYAELYRWDFHEKNEIDTLDKFAEELLINPTEEDFDILFFDRFLSGVLILFPNLNVILFEDLKHGQDCYIDKLAIFFKLDHAYVRDYFLGRERNIGIRSKNGKFSKSITLFQKLQVMVSKYPRRNLRVFLKSSGIIQYIYKKALQLSRNIPVSLAVEHRLLDEKKLDALCDCLLIDLSVAKKFNLDEKRLKLYGYIEC